MAEKAYVVVAHMASPYDVKPARSHKIAFRESFEGWPIDPENPEAPVPPVLDVGEGFGAFVFPLETVPINMDRQGIFPGEVPTIADLQPFAVQGAALASDVSIALPADGEAHLLVADLPDSTRIYRDGSESSLPFFGGPLEVAASLPGSMVLEIRPAPLDGRGATRIEVSFAD